MVIKVDMTSQDLDRQIHVLKFFPEIMDKHFKPALYRSVKSLEMAIRPNIPRLTGRAQKTFASRVTGKGVTLKGQVGWYRRGDPWYINVVEHGAKAHEIKAKPGKFLRLLDGSLVRSVKHPGFSKRGFMAAGFSAMQPKIDATLLQANEAVVKDLAIK